MVEIQYVVASIPCSPLVPSLPGPRLPGPPLPGRRVGDYELLERVGQGGMAEVWMARRAVIPGGLQTCALKLIHGRFTAQPRYRRMFLQEARLALKLRHANVVSVFDVGEVEDRLYMALEWVDGVHLRDFAQHVRERHGELGVPLVCHIVSELLQGLRHAHELGVGGKSLGVVHRDVAPHNVLVSRAGEVKLTDFGIARVVGEMSSGEHVKGRARYMAPEQLKGEPTQASDLFAVGGILHELLDGHRFREGFDHGADWHDVVAAARLPQLRRDDVPPALEALRVALLQPDPARRIGSADEALEWLLRGPAWPAGATTLRRLYRECVGVRRRTGLTDPESQWSTSRTQAKRPAPSQRTATLQPRERAPSWTPTPTASPANEPFAIRRRTISWPPRPVQTRLRWVCLGLWGLAGILAMVAAGLFAATIGSGSSVCIHDGLELRQAVGPHTLVSAKEPRVGVGGGDGLAITAYDP